jgi:hypothetical protein
MSDDVGPRKAEPPGGPADLRRSHGLTVPLFLLSRRGRVRIAPVVRAVGLPDKAELSGERAPAAGRTRSRRGVPAGNTV